MASEEEQAAQDEHSTIPTLPLLSGHSFLPEHSFMATPPLYTTSASIPFTWEEKPGKPRPPSTPTPITRLPNASNILEPPPGRLAICYYQNKAKESPDTVLDGPYMNSSAPDQFISSSFRLFLNDESLDSGKKKVKTNRLLFPSWKLRTFKNGKKEILGTNSNRSFAFPSTSEGDFAGDMRFNNSRIRRSGSLRNMPPKSQFWTSVYQGFKYVIPWKSSRKSRKDVLV